MAVDDARKAQIAAEVGLEGEWGRHLRGGSDAQVRADALDVVRRLAESRASSDGGVLRPDQRTHATAADALAAFRSRPSRARTIKGRR